MKQNKSILILGLVVVLMASLIAYRSQLKPRDTVQTAYNQTIDGLNEENVNQIEIESGGQKINLTKVNNMWEVNGYRVDILTVEQLTKALLTTKYIELRAETKSQHANLGVETEKATNLSVKSPDKQASFVIGKSEADGYFVRVNNGDQVYWIKNVPSISNSININDWLDHRVSQTPETALKAIKITNSTGKTLELKRVGSDWQNSANNQVIDPETLRPIISSLADLNIQELITDEKTIGKLLLTVEAESDNGNRTIKIYPYGKDLFALESSDRKGKSTIDNKTMANLNLDPTKLKAKPPISPTATAAPTSLP